MAQLLQWLPVGLTIVPMVLLLLERGFSLAEIAALGAISAVTVGVLELPTGGLADVIGRKPVLIASAVAHAVALLLLGLSGSFALLAGSAALRGIARALSSGPLEAWYVDTAQAVRDRTTPRTSPQAWHAARWRPRSRWPSAPSRVACCRCPCPTWNCRSLRWRSRCL
jgi:MFS family permease